jgi:hypothetical protein
MRDLLQPLQLMFIFLAAGVIVLPFWKICSKAGYPGALGLLILIPLANLIMLLVLAFAEWPVLKELRALQEGPRPSR